MVQTIILNSSNVVNDGFNSSYEYKFPTPAHFQEGYKIAVQSIMLPYSFFNITSSNNNNIFYYVINGTQYPVNLPDGFYNIEAINNVLQQTQIINGHYLVDNKGNYITYCKLSLNLSKYANQITTYKIFKDLPVGYTNPANIFYTSIIFANSRTAQIYIPNNNFQDIIGFKSGYYPPNPSSDDIYYSTSNIIPNMTPVNALILTCNLINNIYSNPRDVFFTFSPNNTSFGSNIYINQSSLAWVDITAGSYMNLKLDIFDQNFNKIYMNDKNVCFQLLIKNKDE